MLSRQQQNKVKQRFSLPKIRIDEKEEHDDESETITTLIEFNAVPLELNEKRFECNSSCLAEEFNFENRKTKTEEAEKKIE